MSLTPKVRIPDTVKKGVVFTVKVMVKHPMETGRRIDAETGKPIPRFIIKKFVCEYNGKTVIKAEMFPAVAANPYFSFHLKGIESGIIKLTWTEDNEETTEASHNITVT